MFKTAAKIFTGGNVGMITVYKNKRDIPQSSKIVDMNDVYFNQHTSRVIDDRADYIIETIDGVRLCDKYKIVSKFQNEILNIDKLSTGCKTALNILYFPHYVFSIKECGDNALDCIYGLKEGNVFSEYPVISFDMEKVQVVDGTGKHNISSYDDLKVWWEDV